MKCIRLAMREGLLCVLRQICKYVSELDKLPPIRTLMGPKLKHPIPVDIYQSQGAVFCVSRFSRALKYFSGCTSVILESL